MSDTDVDVAEPRDRRALCQMLEDSADFPPGLISLYRHGRSYSTDFIAKRGNIVGLLTAAFDHDFTADLGFDGFELPPAPHALLERIIVRESQKDSGVGRALIETLVEEAGSRGCTFIGGSLDMSSDPTVRIRFFTSLNFTIRSPYFGATIG